MGKGFEIFRTIIILVAVAFGVFCAIFGVSFLLYELLNAKEAVSGYCG